MPDDEFGFAPPPFNAVNALQQIQRAMRDLRLAERGVAYELRGKRVIELHLQGNTIAARVAKRLQLTPEFDPFLVKTAVDQRKLIDEVRRRLSRWEHEE
jgi:hypothetical protein